MFIVDFVHNFKLKQIQLAINFAIVVSKWDSMDIANEYLQLARKTFVCFCIFYYV